MLIKCWAATANAFQTFAVNSSFPKYIINVQITVRNPVVKLPNSISLLLQTMRLEFPETTVKYFGRVHRSKALA